MKSFSERLGYERPVVVDEAPSWLRNTYSNAILTEFFDYSSSSHIRVLGIGQLIEEIAIAMQVDVNRNYSIPQAGRQILNALILSLEWPDFYEVVEMVHGLLRSHSFAAATFYQKKVNESFAKGQVAWRMTLEGQLIRKLPQEVSAVESEIRSADDIGEPVKLHLVKARRFLDEKPCDSTNAVKESISAVESFVRSQPDGGSTLGSTLKSWKHNGRKIPPLLISSIEKLYAFASDEAGVRHGNPKEETLMRDDAEFVYLTSLALLRYLRAVD